MTGVVDVHPGALVKHDDEIHIVIKFRSAEMVVLEHRESGRRVVAALTELKSVASKDDDLREVVPEFVSKKIWDVATSKKGAVERVLALGGGEANVNLVAEELHVHPSTIYRWIAKFSVEQRVADLYRKKRNDVGKPRLSLRQEAMMRLVLKNFHLVQERPSITQTHKELDRRCKLRGLKTPSLDTLKSRLLLCSQRETAEKRGDVRRANKLHLNEGSIPGADFPYALVQIDHTFVDLELVDDENRVSIGRPWITVAIDVFSRMCVGYYVSFDPPGMLGTGLCLTHAIRNKDAWMAKLGVDYEYPCQGKPRIINADNAKEFRGNTLQIACDMHHMGLQFRKLKKPRYGAHIERYMGTLMSAIHRLPGTTKSNVQEKQDYDSHGRAVFTLSAFERWLANLILGEYHHEEHSGLGNIPPIVKFKRALTGEDGGLPRGSLRINTDDERLYLDFLPGEWLTVQQYGLRLDHIEYSADVLRRWVGARDPHYPRRARKFLVKRDPRDISALFFLDPETDRYYRIPYRQLANPHFSIWELRRVRKYLEDRGIEAVDEATIMKARNEMAAIEALEVEKTREAKKRRRYTKSAKARVRRQASPKPEFGQGAPGLPHVFATQTDVNLDPEVDGQVDGPQSGAASTASPRPRSKSTGPGTEPALPFDEIEEY